MTDYASRDDILDVIRQGGTADANSALLALVMSEADGRWVEQVLLECLEGGRNIALRKLAVTCVGHLARIHGHIADDRLRVRLDEFADDSDLAGVVEAARDDVRIFCRRGDK